MCRVYSRIFETDFERLKYWADHEDQSVSEFVADAILERMARLSGDFDVPTVYGQLLNQMSEGILELIRSNESIRDEVNHGFSSILGVMRFGDYVSADLDDVAVEAE